MLQSMRLMVKSWVAKALIALLVLSFAAWGIGDMFISRTESVVATVGEREVDSYAFANAFHARLEHFARSGQEFDVAEAVRLGIDQAVLDEIGGRLALDNAAVALGLSAPDSAVSEEITARPAFQDAAGRFDPSRYARVLSINNMSQKEFEETVRFDVSRSALINAVASGSILPRSFATPIYGRLGEKRILSYVAIGPSLDQPLPRPTEGEIAAYLAENESVYRRPAEADIAFLWINPERLAEPALVSEEQARVDYDLDLDLYSIPATRTLRQIVFETESEAAAARTRLDTGETLLDISGELGLGPETVSLGRVTPDGLAPELAEAAFGATDTGPVGPFRTAFGWAVQEIVALEEAATVPFEEAREDIALRIATAAAMDRIPDMLARAEDGIAAGESLENIGAVLGIELDTLTVDANGRIVPPGAGEGIPDDPDFLTSAFDLLPGDDPDVITLDNDGAAILRVDASRESHVPPLEEVRERILATLESEARAASALAAAESAEARISAGESMESVAGFLGLEVSQSEPLQRYAPTAELPTAVVNRAFMIAPGEHAFGEGAGENAYVFRVDEVVSEDSDVIDGRIEQLLPTLERMMDDEVFQAFSRAVNAEYPILVNRSGVEAALGLLSES